MKTGINLLINLYSSFLELLRLCVLPVFSAIGRKRGWNIMERQKVPYALRDFRGRTIVWVHAASLGETKLLYKFIELLEQRHPDDMYLVTATTKTGVEYLQRNKTPSICGIGFLPFDTIPLIGKILTKYKVTRVWLMETEIWPCMLWACFSRRIPVGIANARIEEKSFKSYIRLKGLLGSLFKGFDIIFAQNDLYARRFEQLGVRRDAIHVVGNLKGHVLIKRPVKDEWSELRTDMNISEGSLVLTAGCLHPGEGTVVRTCLDQLAQKGHPAKCIIVPRHLEDVSALTNEMGRGVVVVDDIRTAKFWDICIVKKIGILDEMYKIADAAFVGGTFIDVGGHNVWDPARFGIPVFFGPDYHTQTESCEKLMSAGVGFKAESPEELAGLILKVLKKEARKFINAQMLFMETVNKRQSVIEPLLP